MSSTEARSGERRWLLVASLLALAHLFLGLLLVPAPMFTKYPDAVRLLRGGGLDAASGGDLSPLYLLLNLLLPPMALRVLQSLAGAGGALLVFLAGRRWHSAPVGAAAAALWCFTSALVLYEATLEPDVWVAVLGAAALSSLLEPAHRRSSLAWGGVALGLSAALRPAALLGFAGLLLAFAWLWARGRVSRGSVAAFAGSFVLAAAVPLGVVQLLLGPQLNATMSVGQVLHQGNRPESSGLGAQVPQVIKFQELQERSAAKPDYTHALYRELARLELGAQATPAQCEAFWLGKAAATLRAHPADAAAREARKLAHFLVGPEAHDLAEVNRAQRALPPVFLPLGALGALGLGGLAAAVVLRRRLAVLLLSGAGALGVALIFYVTSRYRVGAIPVWCVAGGGLVAGLEAGALRQRALSAALAALLGMALVRWGTPALRDAAALTARARAASAEAPDLERLRAQGSLRAATRTFEKMRAAQPFSVWTRDLRGIPFEAEAVVRESARQAASEWGTDTDADAFLLAKLSVDAGHCQEALPVLEGSSFVGAIFDRSLDPLLLAAECRLARGEPERAYADVVASLARRGGTLEGLAHAVAAGARLPLADQAAPARLAELAALHDVTSGRFALARAFLAWGAPDRALAQADALVEAFPRFALGHFQRSLALAALGRADEAARAYAQALRLFPAHAFETRPLDAAVAAALRQRPDDAELVWLALEHALRAGRLEEAQALAGRARALADPRFAEPLSFLARLEADAAASPP